MRWSLRRRRIVAATLGGVVATAGLLVPGAGATDRPAGALRTAQPATVYIDDPMQTSLGTSWRKVAQNTTIGVQQAPAGLGDGNRGRWLQLTSDVPYQNGGQSAFILHDSPFSSDRGVVLEYDQRIFRTNDGIDGAGAGDGISVFLVDGDIAASTGSAKASGVGTDIDTTPDEPGGFGGGLGYSSIASQGGFWCGNQQGVAGGWLGIGFDVFGNYQKAETSIGVNNAATRPHLLAGSHPSGVNARIPQSIGMRGSGVRHSPAGGCTSQTNPNDVAYWYGMNRSGGGTDVPVTHGGYRWLAGTDRLGTSGYLDNALNDASDYRRVRVTITPDPDGQQKHAVRVYLSEKLDVNQDVCTNPVGATGSSCLEWASPGGESFELLFSYDIGDAQYQADLPPTFKVGFAASTGYAVNYHQIRNVRVATLTDLALTKQVAAGQDAPGDAATAAAGETVTYTLRGQNRGPAALEQAFPATLVDGLDGLPLTDVQWRATATGGAQVRGPDGAWLTEIDGTGALDASRPLLWIGPGSLATPGTVTVTITGRVAASAAPGEYPNTAVVTASTEGGPQENAPENNEDSAGLTIVAPARWAVAKTAAPASGALVEPGSTITYTVTATADNTRDVLDVVLTDDLTDVVANATFVPGSAQLVVGGAAPLLIDDPDASGALETPTFLLPAGSTATLSYAVEVATDAYGARLRNVVVGQADVAPQTCASTDPVEATCSTTHSVPLEVFLTKTADDGVTSLDGAAFRLRADDAGTPGAPLLAPEVLPVLGTDGEVVVGRFRIAPLAPGTYWLEETRAPGGRQLLGAPVRLSVTLEDGVAVVGPETLVSADGLEVKVRNLTIYSLPLTGLDGTARFVALGAAMLLAALVLALTGRRQRRPTLTEAGGDMR